jgi:hypothetical protein
VNVWFTAPDRMHTPIQFPAVLVERKESADAVVVPASMLACCTKLIPPPPPEVTVKATPLLATPFTVTTTFPVVAPVGTDVAMLVALQLVVVAAAPLNVTVPVDPRFVPVIVTAVPTDPEVGDRLVMLGVVPPPLAAGLNAARSAAQLSAVPSVALAEAAPAAAWI